MRPLGSEKSMLRTRHLSIYRTSARLHSMKYAQNINCLISFDQPHNNFLMIFRKAIYRFSSPLSIIEAELSLHLLFHCIYFQMNEDCGVKTINK